jgi:hypothetical protein
MTQPTCETCRFWGSVREEISWEGIGGFRPCKAPTETGEKSRSQKGYSCADYQPVQQKEAE